MISLYNYDCCLLSCPTNHIRNWFYTKLRARLVVYWSGIDHDNDNIILSRKQCQEHLPSNPRECIITKPRPDCPFQEIAAYYYAAVDFLVSTAPAPPQLYHPIHSLTKPKTLQSTPQEVHLRLADNNEYANMKAGGEDHTISYCTSLTIHYQ